MLLPRPVFSLLEIFFSDERALLQGAQEFGYIFDVRTPTSVEIVTLSGREKFEMLNVLDFTSARKRMSVIVRTADNKIILFCKVSQEKFYIVLLRIVLKSYEI